MSPGACHPRPSISGEVTSSASPSVPPRTSAVSACTATSSSPPPCAVSTASPPSASAASATGRVQSAANTPIICRVTPAGLASGPSRLKIVRRPIARRTGATRAIAGWWLCANRKATPTCARQASARAMPMSARQPSASSTSAVPDLEDAPRFPCFATGTPQAATTKVTAVDTFRLCDPSPPVPHTSMASTGAPTRTIRSRSTPAAAAISAGVSPRSASATRKAAISASARSALRMAAKACAASSASSGRDGSGSRIRPRGLRGCDAQYRQDPGSSPGFGAHARLQWTRDGTAPRAAAGRGGQAP